MAALYSSSSFCISVFRFASTLEIRLSYSF